MAAGVDGEAAGIHPDGVVAKRRERLFLSRQRVVQTKHGPESGIDVRRPRSPALRAARSNGDDRPGWGRRGRRGAPFNWRARRLGDRSPNAGGARLVAPGIARGLLGQHAIERPPLMACSRDRQLEFEASLASTDYTDIRLNRWSARPPLVGFDLRAQRVDVVEAPLVAQPLDERRAARAGRRDRRIAQQMRLDGGRRLAEGRPDADVGHARRARRRRSSSSSRRRRAAEISSFSVTMLAVGNPISRPALPPLDDRAVDVIRMAEQRARFVHAALGDQPADARAADDEVLVAHRIDLVGPEPVALPERAQQVKLPLRPWPNRKFAPTQTSETRSHSTSTVRTNVSGIPLRQLAREPHDRHALMPGAVQRLEPLRLGHQQRRRLVGPHDRAADADRRSSPSACRRARRRRA